MARKSFIGKVISTKMAKTAVVSVEIPKKDPVYGKKIRNTAKFKAHNENIAKMGDMVLIEECRPISRDKSWIIKEILNK